nr:hypothetical protein K-LCC10_0192 [Kaumoebavirus]
MTSRFIPQLTEEFPYLSFDSDFWGNIKSIIVTDYDLAIPFSLKYNFGKLYVTGHSHGSVANNDKDILNKIVFEIVNMEDKKFRRMMKHAQAKLLERQSNYKVSQDLYNIFSSLPGSAEYEAAKAHFEALKN